MLRRMLEKGYYSVHDGFETWEEALRASVQPLIDAKAVRPAYADSIVNSVKKFGPYIVIAPNIAIPHAEDRENVSETAVCFMKSNRPVSFSDDPNEDVQLCFVLSSNDEEKHLANLRELMELLMNEPLIERLAKAVDAEQFAAIAKDCPL